MASSSRGEQQIQCNFFSLRCNYPLRGGETCNHSLETCWVTSCRHVFCPVHAKEWFTSHEDCPLCRDGKVVYKHQNLSRKFAQERGRMCNLGMSPFEALQATQTAVEFWVSQKAFEYGRSEDAWKNRQKRSNDTNQIMARELKRAEEDYVEKEKEQKRCQEGIDKNEEELKRVNEQIQRLQRENSELDTKIAALNPFTPRMGEVQYRTNNAFYSPRMVSAPTSPRFDFSGRGRRSPSPRRQRMNSPMSGVDLSRREFAFEAGSPGLGKTSRDLRRNERLAPARTGAFDAKLFDPVPRPGPEAKAFDLAAPTTNRGMGNRIPAFTPGFLGTGRLLKKRTCHE